MTGTIQRRRGRVAAALLPAALVGALVALPTGPAGAEPSTSAVATEIFVNELHYDNAGTDAGEFIEIAGPAGADLTGWSLALYNGTTPASATVYHT
ncbi:MAG: hypothetical protein H0U28_05570, partial [Nocardioidaceae bacterium]|nr:hypothetical protein [Nocardioidaceae bacterium]